LWEAQKQPGDADNASDNPSPQLAKVENEGKRRKKDKGLQLRLFGKKW
jgi:hypothetical protein